MKKLLSLILTVVICASLVACSSNGASTTQYFDTSNEEVLEKNKNFDYEEVTELETFSASSLEDKKIKIYGDARDIDINESTLEMYLEVKNNTPYPLKVVMPSNMVNAEFKEGDTITVYGRFAGLVTKTYKGKSASCWQISAYFIENGNKEDNSQENNTKEKQKTAVEDNTKVETSKQETKQTTNKQTNNTKKNSNNTNNSNNSNTNNDSTCDFCGTSSNSVQWRGNYRLCYSCYQGVVNSAEGDHKLYEEYIDDSNEDNNNLNNDRDNSQYDNSDNTDE